MPSPLLDRPGAVASAGPDAGVAAHYGDPLREQRAMLSTAATVDRSHRDVVRIGGVDRLAWLHSLTTQHVQDLAPGAGAEALLLSPTGHVEHHLVLSDDGTATWADVEPGTGPALAAFLDRMRFLLRVDVAVVTGERAVLSVVGPAAVAAVRAVFGTVADDRPYAGSWLVVPAYGPEPVGVRTMPWPAPGRIDLLLPRAALAEVADRLAAAGAAPAGAAAFEALRVADGVPRLGVDTDERTIPNEVGWLDRAVHLSKGCYRGQETVARVHTLGRPPRRLTLLQLDGIAEVLPAPGSRVLLDGRDVGFAGTVARHAELGPIALALVKRSVPVAATLTVAGMAAAQEVVVPPDTGLGIRPAQLLNPRAAGAPPAGP